MRFSLKALAAPIDPVVATHANSAGADAAIATLRRAGYAPNMLGVVGQIDPRAAHGVAAHPGGAVAHRPAAGALLGLLWAGFFSACVLLHPTGPAGFAALVAMALLTVAVQARVLARVFPPRREAGSPLPAGAPPREPAWRYLVVVHGSRSDVALARAVLAAP